MGMHKKRFEVFTAVTMKNGVFWDVTPCLQESHGVTSQKTPFFAQKELQANHNSSSVVFTIT
jgi:hypothetical protein